MEDYHLLTTLRDRSTHTPYYNDLFNLLLSCDETDRIEAKRFKTNELAILLRRSPRHMKRYIPAWTLGPEPQK